MSLLGPRAFIKSGAEGVICAALPEAGLGLAVKADDGAGRAAQVIIAALIQRLGGFGDETEVRLARFVSPRLLNWSGAEIGRLVPRARWRDARRHERKADATPVDASSVRCALGRRVSCERGRCTPRGPLRRRRTVSADAS